MCRLADAGCMSAQCWCYKCAGRIVGRKTFVRHGKKNLPDAPINAGPPRLPVLSMPEPVAVALGDVEADEDSSDSDHDPLGLAEAKQNEVQELLTGCAKLNSAEIALLFLDWMCKHKLTDSAAGDLWRLLKVMLPAVMELPSFRTLKKILGNAEASYVRRLDLCPNDCIVYYDSTHLKEPYRHAHRFNCNVCGSSRYVTDPTDGAVKPAKTLFLFPVAAYVRSLFARPELVPYLLHDSEQGVEGHLLRSRGFQAKIRDNPYMNNDHRNLGFVGTTDGVPFFDDQRRGAWPFVLRCANLPDALSTHMTNCHLHMLSANEFWELDKDAKVLRRTIRNPKSLKPHLIVAVDDLLGAYKGTTQYCTFLSSNVPSDCALLSSNVPSDCAFLSSNVPSDCALLSSCLPSDYSLLSSHPPSDCALLSSDLPSDCAQLSSDLP